MIYFLQEELSRRKCIARFNYLLEHAVLVELTDATKRSTSQNAFLHVTLGAVALEVGESLEYVKQEIYKRMVNPDIFVTEHDNPVLGRVSALRSSAHLSKEEMSVSIDRFRKWAAEQGIYTPSPDDLATIAKITADMSNARYL
jgi:hypothetical protein